MILLVNFVTHNYQFRWRLNVQCGECAKIYVRSKDNMFQFLRRLLIDNDISVALEEGGTCLNISEALRANGNEKTILQEVVASVSNRSIFHDFVDITKQEADELIEKKVINDILQLRNHRSELRDRYIARASLKRFSEKKGGNGLLLCADRHFAGVKRYLEEAAIHIVSETITQYRWHISNDQIDSLHQNHYEGNPLA